MLRFYKHFNDARMWMMPTLGARFFGVKHFFSTENVRKKLKIIERESSAGREKPSNCWREEKLLMIQEMKCILRGSPIIPSFHRSKKTKSLRKLQAGPLKLVKNGNDFRGSGICFPSLRFAMERFRNLRGAN